MEDPPDDARVREQLRRILASKWFQGRKKDKARALLKRVVEQTLAGNRENLKERNLGVDVFGKPSDYKTEDDAVVRTTAGRVRGNLHAYYHANPADSLEIEIPIGGYAAEFSSRHRSIAIAIPLIPLKEPDPESTTLHVPSPRVTDRIPEEMPATLAGTERATETEVNHAELGATAGPPIRVSLPWRHVLIVVGMILVLVSGGLVVLSKMRSPKLPADVLIIGLAKFSPATPATEILRNRIQQTLESRVYGGPLVEVRLLGDELNADEPDLEKQAKTISGNGVHLVIGARAFDQNAYRPRMAMAQPYHSLTLNNDLADTLETLHLGVNIDGTEAGYRAATLFFSDLIKILYSYQYFPSDDITQLESALSGLHDKTLSALIFAGSVSRLSNYDTGGDKLALFRKAVAVLAPLIGPSAPQACALNSTDDLLPRCYAVVLRAALYGGAALAVGVVERPAYIGRSLLDLRYAEPFFQAHNDQRRVWNIMQARAALFALLGNLAVHSEERYWYSKERDIYDRLLLDISRYGLHYLYHTAYIHYRLAHVLNNLATIEEREDPVLEASQHLVGCADDDAPGNGARTVRGFVQKLANHLWTVHCPLDQDLWAQIKVEQLTVLRRLSGTVLDDGSYDQQAIALHGAAMTVLSEKRTPTVWANCNLALAGVIVLSTNDDSNPREREALNRMAISASDNALRIFGNSGFVRPWVFAKTFSAIAHIRLAELIRDSRQAEQHKQTARELLHEITSNIDEGTLQGIGAEIFVDALSQKLSAM